MSNTTVSFSGHRPDKLGGYRPNPLQDKVRAALRDALVRFKPNHAICGMAIGVDQWAAEECIEMDIPFTAAIPFQGQERLWPASSRAYYHVLLKKATRVEIISSGAFSALKMQIRNAWMVDHSDLLIAVWDGSRGGTANCIKYAVEQERKIHLINPNKL